MSAVKSSRLRSSVAVCAAVAGCGLAAVSSASASTLAVDAGGTVRFTAAGGEANAVNATDLDTPGVMVVTDTGSRIRVGSGCVQVTAHEGRCAIRAGQDFLIDVADGNDFARAYTIEQLGRVRMTGGSGKDRLENLPQYGAEVSGGPGDDAITVYPNFGGSVDVHGDAGNDSIAAVSATGVVNGDAGDDKITLSAFGDPRGGTSAAYGGSGDDSITANSFSFMNLVDGGSGDDTIGTQDATVAVVDGGPGRDEITASADHPEQINGGSGRDVIDGGGAGDSIDCGFGFDRYAVYDGDTETSCELPLTPAPPV